MTVLLSHINIFRRFKLKDIDGNLSYVRNNRMIADTVLKFEK